MKMIGKMVFWLVGICFGLIIIIAIFGYLAQEEFEQAKKVVARAIWSDMEECANELANCRQNLEISETKISSCQRECKAIISRLKAEKEELKEEIRELREKLEQAKASKKALVNQKPQRPSFVKRGLKISPGKIIVWGKGVFTHTIKYDFFWYMVEDCNGKVRIIIDRLIPNEGIKALSGLGRTYPLGDLGPTVIETNYSREEADKIPGVKGIVFEHVEVF